MSEIKQQRNRNERGYLVRSVGRDRSMPKPVNDDNPVLAQQQALGNQAMQRFIKSCPLVLPSANLCPFGGVCHTCPVRNQVGLKIPQKPTKLKQETGLITEKMSNGLSLQPVLTKDLLKAREAINKIPGEFHKGEKLNSKFQENAEYMFDQNIGVVHIHTDATSNFIASNLKAKALTIGNHIFFRSGFYNPNTKTGQNLLIHELTHVLQHRKRAIKGNKTMELEREADDFAKHRSFIINIPTKLRRTEYPLYKKDGSPGEIQENNNNLFYILLSPSPGCGWEEAQIYLAEAAALAACAFFFVPTGAEPVEVLLCLLAIAGFIVAIRNYLKCLRDERRDLERQRDETEDDRERERLQREIDELREEIEEWQNEEESWDEYREILEVRREQEEQSRTV